MVWVVGVTYKQDDFDPIGPGKKSEILDLGLKVDQVKAMHVYFVHGTISEGEIKRACEELFADQIIQNFLYIQGGNSLALVDDTDAWVVQVKSKPGVTDAVGESARKAMLLIGIKGVEKVESAFTYTIKGKIDEEQLKRICEKVLGNPLIHDYKYVRV